MNTAPRPSARRIPALAFPLAAAGVYAILFTLIARVPAASHPGPLASGILADLLLTVPVLWYLLVVRGRGIAAQTLIPVVIVSFAIARFALPPAIRPAKLVFELLLGTLELVVVTVLVTGLVRALRAPRRTGVERGPAAIPDHLAHLGRHVLGLPWLAEILAFEISTFVYAFAGPWMKPQEDRRAFTLHRESGWLMAVIGLGLLIVVEGFPVHVLVTRWSPIAAWIFTASSVYAMVWLIGDFQALRLRPVRVTPEALLLRVGLRSSLRVEWDDLRAVKVPRTDAEKARRRGTLRGELLGEPSVILELARPLRAHGFYGFPVTVDRVSLAPDDRRAFLAAVAEHAPATLDDSASALLGAGTPHAGATR